LEYKELPQFKDSDDLETTLTQFYWAYNYIYNQKDKAVKKPLKVAPKVLTA